VVDAEHGTWGSKTLRGGLHETARKREGGLSFKAMTRRGPRSLLHSCGKSSSLHLPSYLVIKITFRAPGLPHTPGFRKRPSHVHRGDSAFDAHLPHPHEPGAGVSPVPPAVHHDPIRVVVLLTKAPPY